MQPTTQELSRYALFYASQGLPVFPVHSIIGGACSCGKADCKQPGKHPVTYNGLKDASIDPEKISRFWSSTPYNIGVRTGGDAGLFVVDVDTGKGGAESFEAIAGELPPTTKQRTGGGGFHLLYRMPAGLVGKNQNNIKTVDDVRFHGVDTRGDGGYIIAAPSNHASGGVYSWEDNGQPWQDFAEIPRAFLDKYNLIKNPEPTPDLLSASNQPAVTPVPVATPTPVPAPVPVPASSAPAVLTSEDVADIRRALCYIEPEGRDEWLRVGMALHSTHAPEAFALWDEWSQRTGAGNYQAVTQAKTWRGFNRSEGQRGNRVNIETLFHIANSNGYRPGEAAETLVFINDLAPASNAGNTVPESLPEQKHADLSPLDSLSLADLEDNPPPDVEALHLWNGATIARGTVVFLAGAPKVGKSNLVIDFALSAAAGVPWLGYDFARPLKVYWMNAELRSTFVKQRVAPRLAAIADPEARRRALHNFRFTVKENGVKSFNSAIDCKAIAADIERHAPDVVIVDPFINWCDVDENNSGDVKKVLQTIEKVIHSANPEAVSFIVHHTKKAGGNGEAASFDHIRGSGAFRGYYDTGLLMYREPKTNAIKLAWECRNVVDPGEMTLTRGDDGSFNASVDIAPDGTGNYSALQEHKEKPSYSRTSTLADWIRTLGAGGQEVPTAELWRRHEKLFSTSKRTFETDLQNVTRFFNNISQPRAGAFIVTNSEAVTA